MTGKPQSIYSAMSQQSKARELDAKMFKSKGERKIAAFLDRLNIQYTYQPAVLVQDQEYQRIWYPDFGLPKYSIFIEYFGMENDPVYNERTKHKLAAYRNSEIDVISVYPSHLEGNYEGYILKEILRTMSHRLSDLEQKIEHFPARSTEVYPQTIKTYYMPRNVYG